MKELKDLGRLNVNKVDISINSDLGKHLHQAISNSQNGEVQVPYNGQVIDCSYETRLHDEGELTVVKVTAKENSSLLKELIEDGSVLKPIQEGNSKEAIEEHNKNVATKVLDKAKELGLTEKLGLTKKNPNKE